MKNVSNKGSKGITLIALVVTIIVLLILAGISLAMLTGPNGLISKATQAGKDSIIAEQREKIIMAYNDALTSKMGEEVTADDIREALRNNGVSASVSGTEEITVTIDGNTYTINQEGEITGPTPAIEIVEIIADGIGITNEGKVVKVCSVDPNWDKYDISHPWTEVEIEEELDYINSVKKTFCNEHGSVNFIIDNDNNIYSWGYNYDGQLGIGNREDQNTPQQITNLNNVIDIYTNGSSVIAKTISGELYSWGWNYYGQLGIGNNEDQNTPQQITGLNNVEDIYGNGYTVIAKTSSGELYSWGKNNYGELGIGNNENQNSPQQITGLSNIDDIYDNGNMVIAKTKNGELYSWGDNEYGQLGIGNNENQNTPQQITALNNVADIYIEDGMVIAKTSNGELYSWGKNDYGQLGIGNNEDQNTPQQITGLNNVVDIYTDGNSVIARMSNGGVYSWGYNGYGKLGIGNDENQNSPVCINDIEDCDLYGQEIIKFKECNYYIYVETEQEKWYKEYIPSSID